MLQEKFGMNSKMRERIIVITAAILFFAAFGAVAYFDRPHGTVGSDFGEGEFTADIEKNQGHLNIPDLPSDLLVLGAGQDATLDFNVENNDEDNDIDTVYITVPDSTITGGSTEWYIPTIEHDWNLTTPEDDVAKFYAMQDLPGRVFGGSAQYDVAGNIDDALDHSGVDGISEKITISLDLTITSEPGTMTGSDAINLEVSDEQTEPEDGVTPDRFSVEPFPYSYLVLDVDFEFILYSLDSTNGDIEIDYGSERLFGTGSRASDFQSSNYGFKYISDNGNTIVVLDAPTDDTIVNPIIRSNVEDGGSFTLDMITYRTASVDPEASPSEWVTVEDQQMDYSGSLPDTTDGELALDADGDGLFLDNDDDWDNDGVINDEDTSPNDNTVVNHKPVYERIDPSATEIAANKELILTAVASDADEDQLTYAWDVEGESWTGSGREVTVVDFEPGTYTFNVIITDPDGGEDQGSITVTITEAEEEEPGFPLVPVVIIVIIVIIVVAGVLYFVTKGRPEEDEEPMELPPDVGMTGYEEPGMPGGMDMDAGMPEPPAAGGMPTLEPEVYQEETEEVMAEEAYVEPAVTQPVPPAPAEEDEEESLMDEESDLEEVQDLESLLEEMERTEEEIGDVCPECGSPLGPYDSECGSCGAQFEVALECPNCGAVVEDDIDTCPSCSVQFQ